MYPLFPQFPRVLSISLAGILLMAFACHASANGWLVFKSFDIRSVNAMRTVYGRPVYLADGITKASGTNYVVELWTPDWNTGQWFLLAHTTMLSGDLAGYFNGGTILSEHLLGCENATVTIRIWDRTSGNSYESALVKGSTTFLAFAGGCDPPALVPSMLRNFPSFCLGSEDCRTARVGFEFISAWNEVPARYGVARTDQSAGIVIQRFGELNGTNSVIFSTENGSARAGIDYSPVATNLVFLPGETVKSAYIPILPEGSAGGAGSVLLKLSNPGPDASIDSPVATLLILDEDTFDVRLHDMRSFDGLFSGNILVEYVSKQEQRVTLEGASALNNAHWTPVETLVWPPAARASVRSIPVAIFRREMQYFRLRVE